MMNEMPTYAFALMISAMFTVIYIIGFVTGRIWERIEWNKLIRKGIIPKPRKKGE